jgi:hypothetical protein
MSKGTVLSLSAALLMGAAAPSFAQAQPAATPTTTEKQADDLNKVVCEKQESTGSRLAKTRVCLTKAQWAERRLQDRQELERVQMQRGAKGE